MKNLMLAVMLLFVAGCTSMGSENIAVNIDPQKGATMNVQRDGVFVFGETHQALNYVNSGGDCNSSAVVDHTKNTIGTLGAAAIGAAVAMAASGGNPVAVPAGAALAGALSIYDQSSIAKNEVVKMQAVSDLLGKQALIQEQKLEMLKLQKQK